MFKIAGYDRYFLLFDVATATFALWGALTLAGQDGLGVDLLALAWVLMLFGLFSRKRRDEFAQLCWQHAAEATLVALIALPVLLSFGAGFVDGLLGRPRDGADLPAWTLWTLLVAIFFIRFQWARFRGVGR